MSGIVQISPLGLVTGYAMLLAPLGLMLWLGVPAVGRTLFAVARMTVQLLFVGLYLQVVFRYNAFWLTGAWLVVMIAVADVSIVRGCRLRLRRFAAPLGVALLVGAATPLFFFIGLILHRPNLLDAQYAIPIGGMILGNCMRANIVGIRGFYEALRAREKPYLLSLAQGARLTEAVRPFFRDALEAALAPTVATIATIGLVSLPGMMTGVILGGANPMTAIRYQIAIMLAILSGTALTVTLAILLTLRSSFTPTGLLDRGIFRN